MKSIISGLNKAFESRIRLGIMSILIVNDNVDFNTFKELLGVTDGNFASHINALIKLNYVISEKGIVGKKTKTTYAVTDLGKTAFKEHLDSLEQLLKS